MQFSGDYKAKNERMDAYPRIVQQLAKEFASFTLTKILRGDNTSADALAALSSTSDPAQRHVIPVESIEKPSIHEMPNACLINEHMANDEDNDDEMEDEPKEDDAPHVDWLTEILLYIKEGDVPEDKWAARRLKAR